MNRRARAIGWLTVFCFAFFIFAVDGLAATKKSTEKAPDGATMGVNPGSTEAIEKEEGEGKIEVARPTPKSVQKKKFPWLIVGAAVVVVAIVVYFFVLNKKNTLTVILGEGAQGTPAAGAVKYKKNESVPYQYTLAPAFKDLLVKLDGSPVSASGSVKMDKSHTLEATATKAASINVTTTPAGAQVWLDGVKTSWVTPAILYFDNAGVHIVLLRLDGYKDQEVTAQAVMGVETPVNVTLVAGHREDFKVEPSGLWKPELPADWKVQDGNYWNGSRVTLTHYNLLNKAWPNSNYTVSTKFMRHFGKLNVGTLILLITDPAAVPAYSGYSFYIVPDGEYHIGRMTSYNFNTYTGTFTFIQNWTSHYVIAGGLDQWNAVRIIKNGSNYSLYVNEIFIRSFTDATYDPRYVVIIPVSYDMHTETNFDYFYVDLGATAGSIPGTPFSGEVQTGGSILIRK